MSTEYNNPNDEATNTRPEKPPPIPWWWLGQADPIARFTKWLVIVTGILCIATIASVVALIVTDNTLKDTARRQLRAHLLYESATITMENSKPVLSVRFKNSGATPAYEATYWWNVKAYASDESATLEFKETERASMDVGSGGVLDTDEKDVAAEVSAVKSGDKILYVWGVVKYKDVFQRCQYASFALRSGPKIDPGKLILRGFAYGSTYVSDYENERGCKDGKALQMPPSISLPPK